MRTSMIVTAALAAATFTGAAQAQVSFSGNVALTTDYHWRGYSQSGQDLAIQGGFDLETDSGFYAGTWASSVEDGLYGGADIEWDLYAGYSGEITEGFGFDVGVLQYMYPSGGPGSDLDFLEIYAGLSKDFESFGVSGYLYYDPDNETTYASIGGGFSATDALSFDVNVGSYLDGYGEYVHYDLGGTYSVGGFDLDLRWYDNDADDADDNIVFSIGKSL